MVLHHLPPTVVLFLLVHPTTFNLPMATSVATTTMLHHQTVLSTHHPQQMVVHHHLLPTVVTILLVYTTTFNLPVASVATNFTRNSVMSIICSNALQALRHKRFHNTAAQAPRRNHRINKTVLAASIPHHFTTVATFPTRNPGISVIQAFRRDHRSFRTVPQALSRTHRFHKTVTQDLRRNHRLIKAVSQAASQATRCKFCNSSNCNK